MIKIIKNGVVVSVILDTRTINKEGTYPVKIKVYYQGKPKYYSVGLCLTSKEELEEALSFVTGQPDIGIVLLTEKLGRDFPELVNDLKLSRRTPLFVEIPDRHGSGRSKNFITDYVSQAIGLKL